MLRTVIIEDEKPAARRLERMLSKNGLKVLSMLHSVKEAIHWLQHNPNPDLLFLDIQLSDGISFEIFEKVKVKSAIIFTTAYDEYALKAFKLNSVDYLLKPIDQDELQAAIQKFQINMQQDTQVVDVEKIKHLLRGDSKSFKERFTTQIGHRLIVIETKDMECLFSEEKATYAYMNSNKVYMLDGSLENIYEQLNQKVFFRVNRKFIVNITAIKDIISYTNSRLQIKLNNYNQEEIIVSREKVKDFKNWLT